MVACLTFLVVLQLDLRFLVIQRAAPCGSKIRIVPGHALAERSNCFSELSRQVHVVLTAANGNLPSTHLP